jgi:ActR/RegA family two-component response regulator
MSKVLICEDDACLAADLALSVEAAGHTVLGIFSNANDAVAAAEALKPDVAFIDLQLADGHTGGSIAQALQALDVKVIVLSGHPNVGAGLGTVPHTYAAKPVDPGMVELLLNPNGISRTERRNGFADPPLATA